MNKNFVDALREASRRKERRTGSSKLTRQEVMRIRESFAGRSSTGRSLRSNRASISDSRINESMTSRRRGTVAGSRYASRRLGESATTRRPTTGSRYARSTRLGESARRPMRRISRPDTSWQNVLTNYTAFKEAVTKGKRSVITSRELKALRENFKRAQRRGVKLREADLNYDPAQAADPMGMQDQMDADSMNFGQTIALDPALSSQIQDVMNAVDALATSAGLKTDDLDADPMAGIPAVDGMQQADPQQMQQMTESLMRRYSNWKRRKTGSGVLTEGEKRQLRRHALRESRSVETRPSTRRAGLTRRADNSRIQERITQRNRQLRALQEGSLDIPTREEMRTSASRHPYVKRDISYTNSNSELGSVPSAKTLAGGYTSGRGKNATKAGKRWPTKALKQPAESGAIKEKKTVTDIYVDRYFEPKLSFDKIKESMKRGLLG